MNEAIQCTGCSTYLVTIDSVCMKCGTYCPPAPAVDPGIKYTIDAAGRMIPDPATAPEVSVMVWRLWCKGQWCEAIGPDAADTKVIEKSHYDRLAAEVEALHKELLLRPTSDYARELKKEIDALAVQLAEAKADRSECIERVARGQVRIAELEAENARLERVLASR